MAHMLIDTLSATWKTKSVQAIFVAEDAKQTLNMVLTIYTVKTAYWLQYLRILNGFWRILVYKNGPDGGIYRGLQSILKPNHFLWWANLKILGIFSTLKRRYIQEDDRCLVRIEGIETIFYALFDCAKTQYQHTLEEKPRQAMREFQQRIYDKSEANTVKAVAMGTYTMWTAQNNVTFKGENSNREVLVASFMEYVKKQELSTAR
ncbi:hypothetical protein Cgig2_026978 [Carnegiea gigantea]|uniref:Uncharacterized protein n=1 Tax=Carnegiea gigantea TaxID=171969 RepID=A0A9Q1QR78_9CARY|nr:hypothetical protein Cgig2_026978 [Carnegiea gigantea]